MTGLALMLEVGGQVDRGRPALAELTPNGVAAFEGCVETANECGERCPEALARPPAPLPV